MAIEVPFEQPLVELRGKIEELRRFGEEKKIDFTDEIKRLEERYALLEEELYLNLSALEKMQFARHPSRPTTLDYIRDIFTDFVELHGDRLYGDDLAIIGGIAKFGEISVTVIGHQKGKDTKDNILRNFGSPHPDGFRKALRLMQQAAKFKRPILSFIDTKGAYPGSSAEERGVAEAIARNLREMISFPVPMISVIIGEGGSGGALGIAVGNRVLMMENAIYSVASPESAASILYKDSTKWQQAAELMKITAEDMLRFKVIDEIIPEPKGGAHRSPKMESERLKDALWMHLQELLKMNEGALLEDRFQRFRKFGTFTFAHYQDTPDTSDAAEI